MRREAICLEPPRETRLGGTAHHLTLLCSQFPPWTERPVWYYLDSYVGSHQLQWAPSRSNCRDRRPTLLRLRRRQPLSHSMDRSQLCNSSSVPFCRMLKRLKSFATTKRLFGSCVQTVTQTRFARGNISVEFSREISHHILFRLGKIARMSAVPLEI
jgi:hypothetical protein